MNTTTHTTEIKLAKRNMITMIAPADTDIPLSIVLSTARRLLTEAEHLDAVLIYRHAQLSTIFVTVSKRYRSPTNKLSYDIVEEYEATLNNRQQMEDTGA